MAVKGIQIETRCGLVVFRLRNAFRLLPPPPTTRNDHTIRPNIPWNVTRTRKYGHIFTSQKPKTHFSHEISEFRIAPSGMAWKGSDSEGVTAIPSTDIKWSQWMRVARQYQLRVGLKDRKKEEFEGFTKEVCVRFAVLLMYDSMKSNRTTTNSPRFLKTTLESPSKRVKSHLKAGIGVSPISKVSMYSLFIWNFLLTKINKTRHRPRIHHLRQNRVRATPAARRQL